MKRLLSHLSLLYERLWSRWWPATAICAAFAGLALMDVLALFGPRGHAALLVVATLGLLWTFTRPLRLPTRAEVARRMEEAGGVPHRPLDALRDAPAGCADDGSRALWDGHAARMRALAKNVRIPLPRPDVARQDRFALRHAAFLLLLVGLVQAGPEAGTRIERGLAPALGLRLPDGGGKLAVDTWITPPAYTRKAPVFLAASQPGVQIAPGGIEVPAGSELKIRVDNTRRAPRLRFAGRSHAFTRASEKSWILSLPVEAAGTLRLRHGVRDLGAWQVAATPDAAPSITLLKVEEGPQATVKITYAARDDYGVATLSAAVTPPLPLPARQGGEPVTFDLTPPAPGASESVYTADLTAHLRAGREALIVLTATDGAGHAAQSNTLSFLLPERAFTHPVAQAFVAARKGLMDANDAKARAATARDIATAGQDPSAYRHDLVTFLAVSSAVRRLLYDGDEELVRSVQSLLWDAALKLDDGGLSVSARDLAESLDDLSRALADPNATGAQIQEKLAAAQEKMRDWLQNLVGQMARQGQGAAGDIPPGIAQKLMQNINLEDLLRQMQEMSKSGSRTDMRDMAEFMKNAVRNIGQGKTGKIDPKQAEAMKALGDLQEIIAGQQALMDKTSRLAPGEGAEEQKKTQDSLREKLGDAVRRLAESAGDTPANLARADQAMKELQKSLGGKTPRDFVPHQKDALGHMQKSMDEAVSKLARDMRQMMLSLGVNPGGKGGFGQGFDPLGRGTGKDGGQGGDLSLPEGAERRRVQEIIDELRRRSNEYQRPKLERDYIDRLLDRTR